MGLGETPIKTLETLDQSQQLSCHAYKNADPTLRITAG
jgi:hypothetical protein